MYGQNDELMHHGVLGMKWGVRRFQNKDGSLTAAGKKRVQNAEQSDGKLLITNDGYTLKKKKEPKFREFLRLERMMYVHMLMLVLLSMITNIIIRTLLKT